MIIIEDKEKEVLKKFKEKLSDFDLTKEEFRDVHLLRYLRARDLDLKKSEEMIRQSTAWRKEHDAGSILDWTPPTHLIEMMQFEYLGKDKHDNPVFYAPIYKWDFRIFADAEQKDTVLKFFRYCNEKCLGWLKDFGKEGPDDQFPQMVAVYDYKGVQFLKELMNMKAMEVMKQSNESFELNYPEILENALLLNVPTIFWAIFELFKPIMPKKTLEKFVILDSSPGRWRTALLKKIPADVLPRKYGGLRMTPTRDFMTWKELPAMSLDEDDGPGDLIELLIDARDTLSIQVTIHSPGTILTWRFKSLDFDIGFSVVNTNADELVPYDKKGSEKEITGSLKIKVPGKYFVIFDNSFSKIRSKTISYFLTIEGDEKPKEN